VDTAGEHVIKILLVEDDSTITDLTPHFELLRRVGKDDETPVIVITGRNDADEHRELIARVQAILRRQATQASASEPVQLDGLTLDPVAHELTWGNGSVRLTPTELRILYLLVTNAGRVVPASRLYAYVWGSDGADANALRSHMSHLRRKLETLGASPGTISSIPAVGYVFRAMAQPATASRLTVAQSEAGSAA
jgi:DNA-binding response OmpR family regulator